MMLLTSLLITTVVLGIFGLDNQHVLHSGQGSVGIVSNSFDGGTRTFNDLSLDDVIVQQADPKFCGGSFGQTSAGEEKHDLLFGSLQDAYYLAWAALRWWDDNIFEHWFPRSDLQKVNAVFRRIIQHLQVPPGAANGNDILGALFFVPCDILMDTTSDLCKGGAPAYTINYEDDVAGTPSFAIAHFCKWTFENENEVPVPIKLDDIPLSDFKIDGEYRVTADMAPIAATVLHEMIHFNAVGQTSGLDKTGASGAHIGDRGGTDPQLDSGDPYWAWKLHEDLTDGSDDCLANSDSYVWFALEIFWTHRHKVVLAREQGGYFEEPIDPLAA